MDTYIPTLGLDGFLNNKEMMMGKLFTYFMASEYSQSNTFHGKIASMKYALAVGKDKNDVARIMQTMLNNMYGKYFKNVDVNVNVQEVINSDKTEFYIEIKCTDDDKSYTLSRTLKYGGYEIEDYNKELDNFYKYYGGTNGRQ